MGNLNPDPSTILGRNRKIFPRGYLERLGLERRQGWDKIMSSWTEWSTSEVTASR